MKAKETLSKEELNLVTLAMEYSNEDKAWALFESIRWPDGPVCPHCQNHTDKPIYKLNRKPGSTSRRGLHKCGACRKLFTAMVGTIFSDSKIPISKWLMAFSLMSSSKKGVSAHQVHRMLSLTYKTAWFMCHRIRFAMDKGPLAEMLKGTVEVDETYVGGKGEQRTVSIRHTPVVALVERKGKVRTKVVANASDASNGNPPAGSFHSLAAFFIFRQGPELGGEAVMPPPIRMALRERGSSGGPERKQGQVEKSCQMTT